MSRLRPGIYVFRKQLVECQSAEKSQEEKLSTLVDEHSESKEQINYLSNKQKKCAHQKEVLQGRLVQIEQEGLVLYSQTLVSNLRRTLTKTELTVQEPFSQKYGRKFSQIFESESLSNC